MLRAFVLFFTFLFYRYFFLAWFPVSSQRCFSFLSFHLMFFLISLIHSCFFLIPAFFPHLKDIFLFFSLCLFFLLLHTVDTSAVFFLLWLTSFFRSQYFYTWLPVSSNKYFTLFFLFVFFLLISYFRSFPVFPITHYFLLKKLFKIFFLYLTFYLLLWIYGTTKYLHI